MSVALRRLVIRFRSGIANESVSVRDIDDRIKHCIAKRRFWDGNRVCLERQATRYPLGLFIDCFSVKIYTMPSAFP